MREDIKIRIQQIVAGVVPNGYQYQERIGIAPVSWKVRHFSDVVKNVQHPVPKPNAAYWRLGIRSHAKGTFHELVEDPSAVAMDELYVVKEGALIVNITFAWEHAIALAGADDAGKLVSHRFPTYEFKEKQSPKYFKGVVIQPRFKEMLSNISPGGAGRNRVLSKKDFLKLPCYIPPQKEQEKIAEILNHCDKVIELKKKFIEEERNRKKWLMQNLLDPNSGVRLPGFEGEWKLITLEKCTKSKGRYGLNAPACVSNPELPRYIRITDIDDDGNFIKENDVCVDHPASGDYLLSEGDLLFVRTGATVGKSYKYSRKDGELVYAGFLINFSIDTSKYNSYFVYTACNTSAYWGWVNAVSARSGQPGINAEEYGSYKFKLPPTLEEQNAIAKVITFFDERINLLERELTQWQQKKKALMQLLLTGIVRVSV